MSIQQKELSCALCHAYLFPEDDVVYCPVCGAPHHRECYNSIEHCALESLHNTENQYDKIKKQEQPKEEKNTQENEPQPNFNTPFGEFSPIDFLGGVKPDFQIAKGITAKETAGFVFSNTMRYIPKFVRLNKNHKISFNFLAFLFPGAWFLSRKMYKNGIITAALSVAATILTIPFQQTLLNLGLLENLPYMEMLDRIAMNMDKISVAVVFASFIGGVLNLVVKLVSALLGDYWYKKHTIKTIREIKKTSADIAADFRKKGGVNFFLFFIGLFAVQYIPAIIATFI